MILKIILNFIEAFNANIIQKQTHNRYTHDWDLTFSIDDTLSRAYYSSTIIYVYTLRYHISELQTKDYLWCVLTGNII